MKIKGNINTINLINPKRKITPKLILYIIGYSVVQLLILTTVVFGVFILAEYGNKNIMEYDDDVFNFMFGLTSFNTFFCFFLFIRQMELRFFHLEHLENMIKYKEY